MKDVPEIRFKEFEDAWESKLFGDILDFLQNIPLSRSELTDEKKEFSTIHYGDILINYSDILNIKFDKIFSIDKNLDFNKYNKSFINNGDIIFADAAEDETVGKCVEIDGITSEKIISGLHTIPCRSKAEFSKKYLGFYLNSYNYHSQLIPLMQGIKVLSISKNSLKKTYISYPISLREQGKIGFLFYKINNSIELLSKKIDLLKKYKELMLSKMFPKDGCDVPEIRFSEFTEPWEERKFDEIVTFFSGLTYTPNNVRSSGTLVLRSSNVNNGEIIDADNVYVDSSVVNSESVKVGDIIVVVRNGSRNLIGKHARIKRSMSNTVIGAFMCGIRSKTSLFTNALLDTQKFEKEIEKNLGATINQITGYMFSNMKFYIPKEIEEQIKIGLLFDDIDNILSLSSKVRYLLNNMKQSLLSKMFI